MGGTQKGQTTEQVVYPNLNFFKHDFFHQCFTSRCQMAINIYSYLSFFFFFFLLMNIFFFSLKCFFKTSN